MTINGFAAIGLLFGILKEKAAGLETKNCYAVYDKIRYRTRENEMSKIVNNNGVRMNQAVRNLKKGWQIILISYR